MCRLAFPVICIAFFSIPNFSYAVDSDCIELFKKNKLAATDKSCLSKCTTIRVDMGSYMCPLQCENYCKDSCKDILKKFEQSISSKSPSNWPNKEKVSVWSKPEKRLTIESLSRIPDELTSAAEFEIFKLEKSLSYPNPASNAAGSKLLIAVYNSLFSGSFELDTVLVHEFAHQYYRSMKPDLQKNYRDSTNWFSFEFKDKTILTSRSAGFVQEDGKENPEEDFANNLETYLTNPEKLKSIYAPAFDWIKRNIGDLKMQKGCRYEK